MVLRAPTTRSSPLGSNHRQRFCPFRISHSQKKSRQTADMIRMIVSKADNIDGLGLHPFSFNAIWVPSPQSINSRCRRSGSSAPSATGRAEASFLLSPANKHPACYFLISSLSFLPGKSYHKEAGDASGAAPGSRNARAPQERPVLKKLRVLLHLRRNGKL